MKTRYPMLIDATRSIDTSSKKHIKSDSLEAFSEEAFEKVE